MARVTGVGGIYFAARNPEALSQWYSDHLGIPVPSDTYDESDWQQEAGPTRFVPTALDVPHIAATGWSISLRVDDLDALVRQLHGSGVDVQVDPEIYPNGRFADLCDPEGNLVQLWQPSPI